VKPLTRSLLLVALVALLALAAASSLMLSRRGALPDGLIQANGRIEGDPVMLASKFAGRIAQVKVREGDAVKAGQVLAVLDDAQSQAREDQAVAALAVLDAQVDAAAMALAVLQKETPLAIDRAGAGVARADATVTRAVASESQAGHDARRFGELAGQGMVAPQRGEEAELARIVAVAEHEAARTAAVEARKGLADAQLGWERLRAKAAELAALKAQREQARAVLAEARSALADLTLTSPIAGVVMTKIREAGEVIGAGAPVLELVDLDHLHLKVYVPESQIGRLRRGLPARLYIDAYPDTAFEATVSTISSRAEFTPKEVQTPDERVKLTYAVELHVDRNPQHCLTPGLPADAVIRWKDGAAWARPRW
jgi:HlyD family secretion protein